MSELPAEAVGLCLYRIDRKERLWACEAMRFENGRDGVDTVLRRAAVSGRVEIGGEIANHFADVLDDEQTILTTVALDAKSYGALKNKWMRCRLDAEINR